MKGARIKNIGGGQNGKGHQLRELSEMEENVCEKRCCFRVLLTNGRKKNSAEHDRNGQYKNLTGPSPSQALMGLRISTINPKPKNEREGQLKQGRKNF